MAHPDDPPAMAIPMPMGAASSIRTIRVQTADGQGHVFDYETDVKKDNDKALLKEIQRKLVQRPMYDLQTLPDGTTATFLTEVTDAYFLGEEPEEP